jgi:hypothetical protein
MMFGRETAAEYQQVGDGSLETTENYSWVA